MMLQARALQLRGGGSDPVAAVAIYRRVAALVPESAEVHLRLSEALQESQDVQGALAPARRAVVLAPRNAEARAHLGLLLYQLFQKDAALAPEAARELRTATALLPQDPELWARLGEVSEQMKDGEGALQAWLHLGRLRPSFQSAWERAAIHARALQNYEGRREAGAGAQCQESRRTPPPPPGGPGPGSDPGRLPGPRRGELPAARPAPAAGAGPLGERGPGAAPDLAVRGGPGQPEEGGSPQDHPPDDLQHGSRPHEPGPVQGGRDQVGGPPRGED